MNAKAANPKLRIVENATIGVMASALLFVMVGGGPIAFLCSAFAMTPPLVLLHRLVRTYERSELPLICGALAFGIVTVGYIVWFYIAQELDAPRVAAAIAAGTASPPAQAGLAGIFIPIQALFAGGAAYVAGALLSFPIHFLLTRRR